MEERKEKGKRGHEKVGDAGDAGDAAFPIRQVWRMQKKEMPNGIQRKWKRWDGTQKRLDSHDLIIDMIGLYWVKHIFGIYSAYIQHILEPEGNHEENRRKTGGG